MTRVLQFGDYVFADIGVEFGTTFGDSVPRTTRLPGLSGGFDEFGDGTAPTEIGNVRFNLILKAATAAEMQAKRDALNAIKAYGKQPLIVDPEDGGDRRVCQARVANIQMSERYAGLSWQTQRVTINWQVSDPVWERETPSEAAQGVSGLSTPFTVSNAGNADALPRIVIATGVGETGEDVTVERLVDSVVVDQVASTGVLGAGATLEIDCKRLSVRLDGADAYAGFSFLHPAWFRLKPGANSLRVTCANAGDAATVTFHFNDTWS